ncbi:MAG: single-stranded DNA-binding protein [Clostridia bacterium]|nr:single-stranded DNA-binding protein [Clostridia bacterium]MBQ8963630.1 single-stranded DNA-binding protein [Clostridia bacterium]
MNKWIGIGNLVKDPESGMTQSGIAYCNFTVACQRKFANAQGVREADFFNCKAWRQTAEFVSKYFCKGQKIAIEGTIQNRSYDAQDGSKRWVTEVIVDSVEFTGTNQQNNQQGQSNGTTGSYGQPATGQTNRNGTIPGIMQRPQNQQQRMDLNGQNNGFTEVEDDELPF